MASDDEFRIKGAAQTSDVPPPASSEPEEQSEEQSEHADHTEEAEEVSPDTSNSLASGPVPPSTGRIVGDLLVGHDLMVTITMCKVLAIVLYSPFSGSIILVTCPCSGPAGHASYIVPFIAG